MAAALVTPLASSRDPRLSGCCLKSSENWSHVNFSVVPIGHKKHALNKGRLSVNASYRFKEKKQSKKKGEKTGGFKSVPGLKHRVGNAAACESLMRLFTMILQPV